MLKYDFSVSDNMESPLHAGGGNTDTILHIPRICRFSLKRSDSDISVIKDELENIFSSIDTEPPKTLSAESLNLESTPSVSVLLSSSDGYLMKTHSLSPMTEQKAMMNLNKVKDDEDSGSTTSNSDQDTDKSRSLSPCGFPSLEKSRSLSPSSFTIIEKDKPRSSSLTVGTPKVFPKAQTLSPTCYQQLHNSRSLSPTAFSQLETLSPAAFSRLLKVPSSEHLARDLDQPSSGSISSMPSPFSTEDENDEDDEEVDKLTSLSYTRGKRANHRKRKKKLSRPSTPPALSTEIASVSHKLAQIGLKERLRIPDRTIDNLKEVEISRSMTSQDNNDRLPE